MSSALKKKILAGNGMPPALMRNEAFWNAMTAEVDAWAKTTLGDDLQAAIGRRAMITGADARTALEARLGVALPAARSPGLCAIAIDTQGGMACAAHRLGQDSVQLEGASNLFFKLIFEQSALTLTRAMTANIVDHAFDRDDAAFCELAEAKGGFEPQARYLSVEINLTSEPLTTSIYIVFDFEFMQKHQAQLLSRIAPKVDRDAVADHAGLRKQVLASQVEIDAVLDRVPLTIGDCFRFEPNQVIRLPNAAARQLSLAVETDQGTVDLGRGEMGIWKGQRALKLSEAIKNKAMQAVADA